MPRWGISLQINFFLMSYKGEITQGCKGI